MIFGFVDGMRGGFLLLAVSLVAPAWGWNGGYIRLPDPNRNPAMPPFVNGLSVAIDSRWHGHRGYRPISIEVRSALPTKQDRTIRFEGTVRPLNSRGTVVNTTTEITHEFILPAEAEVARGWVYLPEHSAGEPTHLHWRLGSEGLKGVVAESASLLQDQSSPRRGSRGLLRMLSPEGDGQQGEAARSDQLRAYRGTPLRIDGATCEPMPSWLGYSAADLVMLPLPELKRLADKSPDRLLPIIDWVASGGYLCIVLTGSQQERLVEIAELLELDSWQFEERPTGVAGPLGGAPGWWHDELVVKKKGTKESAAALLEQLQQGNLGAAMRRVTPPTSRGWYAWHALGFGRVVVFPDGLTSLPSSLREESILNSVRTIWAKQGWHLRHGMEVGKGNASFANLLIPGVGLAPVLEFQALITLFVLLIGPLNYWLLWRSDRLHWMAITTPLFAGAITLGLLGYGLLGEGFGTHVRARSITLLNQPAQAAASWSRMTHYAPSAPDTGLVMPLDVALYPIEPAWHSALGHETAQVRKIESNTQEQRVVSGGLPSRTSVQHLALRCRRTPHHLRLLHDDNQLEVANQLGAQLELLIVRDQAGAWWMAQDVEPREPTRLEPIAKQRGVSELRLRILQNKPEMPLGAGDAAADALDRLSGSRRRTSNVTGYRLEENRLNQMFDRLAGLDGSEGLMLLEGSYVAVTAKAVETPLGVTNVAERGSFHLVVGRW